MLDGLKGLLEERIEKWNAEIDASPDKKTVIDITIIFNEILTSNISVLCFGEDISMQQIDLDVRKSKNGSDFTLVRKRVTLAKALNEMPDQVIISAGFKTQNPLYQLARKLTGRKNFTEWQRKVSQNGKDVNRFMLDYVQRRKNSEVTSQADGYDFLTLFLNDDPTVFSD